MNHDLPDRFVEKAKALLPGIDEAIATVDRLLTNNRIFIDRMSGAGRISREDALSFGFTGPCLRACGVPYDVRRAKPYLGYENLEFDIPTHPDGDCYSRYVVRMEEMRQSRRILAQVLDKIPDGPINVDDPRVSLPEKSRTYNEMEALIRQFKIIMEGVKPPQGEVYHCTEGGNGELGYYIVSDGTGTPYRVRVRPPCFLLMAGFSQMIRGQMLADLVATMGSLNIIAGELDR